MQTIRFGRTGLLVSRVGFGAIPIQRLAPEQSTALLRRAYEGGVTLYDTARGYTDSEEKIGLALSDVRRNIILTTKTPSLTRAGILSDIEASLKNLRTDYIDVYQLHNPHTAPGPGDESYDTLLELKRAGKIRFIGLTNHDLNLAEQAARSGYYDTVQFPLSPLSNERELALPALCARHNVGLLAMKALSGGLITRAVASYVFLREYPNVAPIWGIQHMWELEEFLSYEENPPDFTEELREQIKRDRKELSGAFCRGCEYCLPCPADIPIHMAARMSLLLRRANPVTLTTEYWRAQMSHIENCTNCGHCKAHCPYGLDTPTLLRGELEAYREYLAANG